MKRTKPLTAKTTKQLEKELEQYKMANENLANTIKRLKEQKPDMPTIKKFARWLYESDATTNPEDVEKRATEKVAQYLKDRLKLKS